MELGATGICAETKKRKRAAVSAPRVHARQFAALGWKNSSNSYDYATRTNILQEVPKLQVCVSHEADKGKAQLKEDLEGTPEK